MEPRTGVIVVAAGSGSRMGGALPKQFRLLGGRPLLARSIDAFAKALPGAPIVVVLPAGYVAYWHNLTARFDMAPHTVTTGGTERFHSVRNGLAALPQGLDLIAVHDGARPLVPVALIRRAVALAAAEGSAVPVIRPADSFRTTEADGSSHPVDRSRLRAVQTPQVFDASLLERAYRSDFSVSFTDDATLVESCGCSVALCAGERRNFKITEPEDLLLAEALLAAETETGEAETPRERHEAGCRGTAGTASDDFAGGAGPIR